MFTGIAVIVIGTRLGITPAIVLGIIQISTNVFLGIARCIRLYKK